MYSLDSQVAYVNLCYSELKKESMKGGINWSLLASMKPLTTKDTHLIDKNASRWKELKCLAKDVKISVKKMQKKTCRS